MTFITSEVLIKGNYGKNTRKEVQEMMKKPMLLSGFSILPHFVLRLVSQFRRKVFYHLW